MEGNYHIRIAGRSGFAREELLEMFRFRAQVFRKRLGWDVPLLGEMDVDGYDALDPEYVTLWAPAGNLCGCIRLLPTTGPTMLRDTFATILHGRPAPFDPGVFELSRFAVMSDDRRGYGFSCLTQLLVQAVIDHGHHRGLRRYVTVTTPAVERLLLCLGLHCQRYTHPQRVGRELALALQIDIDSSRQALIETGDPVRTGPPRRIAQGRSRLPIDLG